MSHKQTEHNKVMINALKDILWARELGSKETRYSVKIEKIALRALLTVEGVQEVDQLVKNSYPDDHKVSGDI